MLTAFFAVAYNLKLYTDIAHGQGGIIIAPVRVRTKLELNNGALQAILLIILC